MNRKNTELLLRQVQSGALSIEDALVKLKSEPFEDLGFAYVSLDLLGYRMGSMNETLPLSNNKKE